MIGEILAPASRGERTARRRGAPMLCSTSRSPTSTAESLMEDVLCAAGERSVLLITHRPGGLGLVDDVVVLP